MGFFRRDRGARAAEAARRESESAVAARDAMFSFDTSGPEKATDEARQALQSGDSGHAFERSVKAVDRLHDFYVFERFTHRQPSPTDEPIVATLIESLERLREDHPNASVRDGVMEATHRLRTISTAIDDVGGDSTRYRRGLDDLARLAPDVDVSGVFWH
ncbi:MAG: hypothetical protein ACOYXM_16695 [Actinomycetota bacterium]